jgi:sRNA-binding carbon storage regulator CsrA
MLILTRADGEAITIEPESGVDPNMTIDELFRNGPIRIRIFRRDQDVRVGIDAPQELLVLRDELNITSEAQ